MKRVSTVVYGNVTYEVCDREARNQIKILQEKIEALENLCKQLLNTTE